MPTGESMMPASSRRSEQVEGADFKNWIEVDGDRIKFKHENMPDKAYADISFYRHLKSMGLADDSEEIKDLFSKFKKRTGYDLAEFLAYYEETKRKISQQ